MSISLVGTNTPPQYSARYVASVQTSSAIGTIVGPVIGGTLAGIFGVRGSLQASAALVFISALLAIFFVQERRKPEGGAPTTLAADFRAAFRMPVMGMVLFISLLGQAASMSIQPVLVLQVESMLGQESSAFWSGVILALPGIAFALQRDTMGRLCWTTCLRTKCSPWPSSAPASATFCPGSSTAFGCSCRCFSRPASSWPRSGPWPPP